MTPAELAQEKTFYERFWALHADPQLVKVFARFGYQVFRRSSVLEGFNSFLNARNVRGRRCIEIGTCKGLTAIVLARFFEEVITIDVVPDPERLQIASYLGIENIKFIDVRDNTHKAEVIAGYDFDGAYVDGDHARDTRSDFELVKHCGRVVFHEYWEAQPPVWDLVNELSKTGSVVTNGKLALWTI